MIQSNKKGFTIVELMLAMTFVSLLAVGISVAIIQMSDLTTKGNTLRELNTINRAVNDDFKRSFNSSGLISGWGVSTNHSTSAGDNVYFVKANNAGAFCSGKFSYLWNNGQHLSTGILTPGATVGVRYAGAGARDTSIRLIRVNDRTRLYCRNLSSWTSIPRGSGTVEVFSAGETNMMLFDIDFRKNRESVATGQSIIQISYTLGTARDDGRTRFQNCEGSNDDIRCAAGQFTTVVRTLGR